MSWAGTPSVMVTTSRIPASAASMMASAQNGAGTRMRLATAPVFATASFAVSNTGRPRWVVPPLPGVTPPTTLLPYAIISFAWNVPLSPVKPWTMTRVFSSSRILMCPPPERHRAPPRRALRPRTAYRRSGSRGRSPSGSGGRPRRWCPLVVRLAGTNVEDDERDWHPHVPHSLDHSQRHPVAAVDPSEYVH